MSLQATMLHVIVQVCLISVKYFVLYTQCCWVQDTKDEDFILQTDQTLSQIRRGN